MVDHKFFICGHSYNECDRDFGLIELKKKHTRHTIYVPEQWSSLVCSASRKFIVYQMEDNDFVDLDSLLPYFRKSITGISKMQWLRFTKNSPDTLFFKSSAADGLETFNEMPMKAKPRRGRVVQHLPGNLPPVVDKPVIKPAKYKDLMEQLPYIPPVYHDFFKNLNHEGANNDNLNPTVENENEEEDETFDFDRIYETDDND